MVLFDLHTHSNVSDGTFSPVELVREAYNKGLSAIALTDHDTIGGFIKAVPEAERLGVKLISGVEISASEYNELHILGLGIDINNNSLNSELEKCAASRKDHIYNICNLLKEKNLRLDAGKIIESAGYSVGKPHIANAMIQKGYVKTQNEAFDKYLETPQIKNLKKYKIGYKKAVELIHGAGGFVVLAHPHKIELNDIKLDDFVDSFTGLDGIEAFYSEHTSEQTEYLLKLAERNNLLISCGSDFHGKNKPDIELGTGLNNSLLRQRELFPVGDKKMIITKFL